MYISSVVKCEIGDILKKSDFSCPIKKMHIMIYGYTEMNKQFSKTKQPSDMMLNLIEVMILCMSHEHWTKPMANKVAYVV